MNKNYLLKIFKIHIIENYQNYQNYSKIKNNYLKNTMHFFYYQLYNKIEFK
jgi:hypothetical protein